MTYSIDTFFNVSDVKQRFRSESEYSNLQVDNLSVSPEVWQQVDAVTITAHTELGVVVDPTWLTIGTQSGQYVEYPSISGHVYDENGNPIQNALVAIKDLYGAYAMGQSIINGNYTFDKSVITDASGYFSISNRKVYDFLSGIAQGGGYPQDGIENAQPAFVDGQGVQHYSNEFQITLVPFVQNPSTDTIDFYGQRIYNEQDPMENHFTGAMNNRGEYFYVTLQMRNEYQLSINVKKAPVVTTSAGNIQTYSAAVSGNIVDFNGSDPIQTGICWATHQDPTIDDSKTEEGTNSSFGAEITGLDKATKYYAKAYATTAGGTVYGNQVEFTTLPTLATVTTTEADAIEPRSAIGGGTVTDGGGLVGEQGICWSLSQNPTVSDFKIANAISGEFDYSMKMENLIHGRTYYVRAYATNALGTSYGNEVSFATLPELAELSNSTSNLLVHSVDYSANITDDGGAEITERGVCWSVSANPTTADSKATNAAGAGQFSGTITGIDRLTTYYIRAYAINSVGTAYSSQISITTPADFPTLSTDEASSVQGFTATGGGNVTDEGGATVTSRGVCWSTSQNPTISNSKTTDGGGLGTFTSSITGLVRGTTYYLRAYATNSAGTSYGTQVSFTTQVYLATLTTGSAYSISAASAAATGNVTDNGGAAITSRGLCWSTSQNPTVADSIKAVEIDIFSSFATSTPYLLTRATTYYMRAYATNSAGTAYGNQISFTTLATAPSLTTAAISSITATTAVSGGSITDNGGSVITAKGICWSRSQNPTTTNDGNYWGKTTDGTGSDAFTSLVGQAPNPLTKATTYYVRAYATNSIGTSYGTQVSFTTLPSLPVVSTGASVTSPGQNGTTAWATATGTVTDTGGSVNQLTETGICWSSTNSVPTTADSKAYTGGTGVPSGSFAHQMAGLARGTVYYFRAYASNNAGTSYGSAYSFTSAASLPTVTTTAISSITATSSICGGSITDNGGATITAKGICWATTQNPTTSNSKTTDGTGTASFVSSITGLTRTTTYYVRAYATNSAGTAYGTQVSFTTSKSLASVTTISPAATLTGASTGATIVDTGGGTVTNYGICWGTASNPDGTSLSIDGKNVGGSETVYYQSNLLVAGNTLSTTVGNGFNGVTLVPYTKYYVRAFITNEIGKSYGTEYTFTTSDPEFITVWNTTKSGITSTNQIAIPTYSGSGFTYSYTVDWGDGTTSTNQTGNATHSYSVAGTYSVKISGTFPGICFNFSNDRGKLMEIKNWGSRIEWKSMADAFAGCSNLVITSARDTPNLSKATSMQKAFFGCALLVGTASIPYFDISTITVLDHCFAGTIFNGPIGNWNTGAVTSMNSMFTSCSTFNQNIGNWNTAAVISMKDMFYNATAFNQPLNNWNVSKVTNMSYMFYYATAFNQPLNNWDVSKVTNMSYMLHACFTFNQPIGSWNVSSVTNMSQMFTSCFAFNMDLGLWDVSKVTNMQGMFQSARDFNNGGTSSISNWNTGAVTDMGYMFHQSGYFNQPIGNWNTSNVTNMYSMFTGRTSAPWTVFNQNIGTWNVSKVLYMGYMFNNNGNFNNGGATAIGDWNTGAVTDMSSMFQNAQAFNQPIGRWNVSNVTNMHSMFYAPYGGTFNQDIGAWNVSKVSWMVNMFRLQPAFNNGGNNSINNWVPASAQSMSYMFANTPFNQPIGNWNVATASNMSFMFSSNTAFNQNIGTWNTGKVTNFESMFQNATAFNNGGTSSINNWTTSVATTLKNMFNGSTAFDQPVGNWNVSSVTDFSTFMASKTPTTLSAANLDSIYNGWSTRTLVSGRYTSFGTAKYTSASSAGRTLLTTSPKSWVITDGGVV